MEHGGRRQKAIEGSVFCHDDVIMSNSNNANTLWSGHLGPTLGVCLFDGQKILMLYTKYLTSCVKYLMFTINF